MTDFRNRVNRILKAATSTFGEAVVFYPKSGGVYKCQGIFDNEYQAIDPDTEQVISSNQPALGINLNDLPIELNIEDLVKIRGYEFRIVDKREDGQGGATLLLHKVKRGKFPDTKANEA